MLPAGLVSSRLLIPEMTTEDGFWVLMRYVIKEMGDRWVCVPAVSLSDLRGIYDGAKK